MLNTSIACFTDFKFNQENLKLWIKALRSGEYEQTFQILKDNNGYCCLGVLCEISQLIRFELTVDGTHYSPVVLRNGQKVWKAATPPLDVMEWLITNYTQCDSSIRIEFNFRLIEMNDNLHRNFNQIADFLAGFLDEVNDNTLPS